MKEIAPVILRIGLSLVFLWFGFMQLTNTGMWVGLIPDYAINMSGLTAETLVRFNGAFEVIFGIALLLGFMTRIVSLLLALHMFHILLTVGFTAIGVRDFGLAVSTLALFLLGPHKYSLDNWLCTRNSHNNVQV